jgi:D-alanyl-D-alanine carboxypeptidase
MKRIVLIQILLFSLLSACQAQEPEATTMPTATNEPITEPTIESEAEPTIESETEPTAETVEAETEATPADSDMLTEQEDEIGFGTGIFWQWRAFTDPVNGEMTIPAEEKHTISLTDDGTTVLATSCRVAVGSHEIEGNSLDLTFDLPEKLDESCVEGPQTERFFTLLQNAVSYSTQDDRLFIDLLADAGTMMFELEEVREDINAPEIEKTTVIDLCGEQALTLQEIEATLDETAMADLDAFLPTLINETTSFGTAAPGVSLLVITPEGRYYKSIGVADVESCTPLPADALFEIGSNTKMMTAAMIYQLQEEGVLSTSDLIGEWVPEMAAIVPNGDQITIDMLLTHTSGIFDYLNGVAEDGPLAAGVEDKAVLTAAYTPEELVTLAVESGAPYFAPGAEGEWAYSNTGYVLLGLIIEAATGQSYAENLEARIFEPLGLEKTMLVADQPDPDLLPEGYYQPPFEFTTGEWNLSQGWSAGAVISDAEEMAVFLKALFSGALFQDPTTLDLMLAPALPGNLFSTYYGHGMVYKNGLLGHGGQALGFQSDVGYLPDDDVTIVIWSNSAENQVGQAAPEVARILGLIPSLTE